jgi:hypothetical protein
MARGRINALEIPDRLLGVGIEVGEEAAPIGLGEDAGETLGRGGQRSDVENIDDEEVSWRFCRKFLFESVLDAVSY